MGKQTKVLHGSCSEVYINGVRDVLATKIEVKVTGDFEDGAFCGDYGTFPIYNGYAIEGTLTDKKTDSTLEVAIAEGYRTGVMPDIVLITALTNPATRQVERWSVSGVVFTEVALANIEAKKAVLEIYGELSSANGAMEALECGKHALYTVCPQLQDRNLQAELGVAEDPMRIIDALFSLPEQDVLGGEALRFMGLLAERSQAAQAEDQEETPDDPGLETVKN